MHLGAQWKPTAEDADYIRNIAKYKFNPPTIMFGRLTKSPSARRYQLQPILFEGTLGQNFNMLLVEKKVRLREKIAGEIVEWKQFRKGVPLNSDGKAVIEFFVNRNELRPGNYADLYSRTVAMLGTMRILYDNGRMREIAIRK